MQNKQNLPNNDLHKDNHGDSVEKGGKPDIMRSYIPDFQYTPPTPSTPPPAQGNSDSDGGSGSSSSDES